MRILTAAVLLALAAPSLAADRYEFDENHHNVRFTFNHLGFSNISASFEELEGHVMVEPADLAKSKIDVTIPLGSVRSGVEKFDAHLESADFFEVAKHPNARFVSTAIEQVSEKKLKVTGDLTLNGITKPVVLDATINKMGEHPMAKTPWLGFDATTTIKRSDFDVDMAAPNVSDEVEVFISAEMKKVG